MDSSANLQSILALAVPPRAVSKVASFAAEIAERDVSSTLITRVLAGYGFSNELLLRVFQSSALTFALQISEFLNLYNVDRREFREFALWLSGLERTRIELEYLKISESTPATEAVRERYGLASAAGVSAESHAPFGSTSVPGRSVELEAEKVGNASVQGAREPSPTIETDSSKRSRPRQTDSESPSKPRTTLTERELSQKRIQDQSEKIKSFTDLANRKLFVPASLSAGFMVGTASAQSFTSEPTTISPVTRSFSAPAKAPSFQDYEQSQVLVSSKQDSRLATEMKAASTGSTSRRSSARDQAPESPPRVLQGTALREEMAPLGAPAHLRPMGGGLSFSASTILAAQSLVPPSSNFPQSDKWPPDSLNGQNEILPVPETRTKKQVVRDGRDPNAGILDTASEPPYVQAERGQSSKSLASLDVILRPFLAAIASGLFVDAAASFLKPLSSEESPKEVVGGGLTRLGIDGAIARRTISLNAPSNRSPKGEGESWPFEGMEVQDKGVAAQPKGAIARAELAEVTLIAPPMQVASEQSEVAGTGVAFSWRRLASGIGELDEAGLAHLSRTTPPGAELIFPAIHRDSLGPNAVNLRLDRGFATRLIESYGVANASAVAHRSAVLSRLQTSPLSVPTLHGRIVPVKDPIGHSPDLLGESPSGQTGALGEVGKGQATRGATLGFLGIPVRIAPSLAARADVAAEVAVRQEVDAASNKFMVRPKDFAGIRDRVLTGFQSVTAEPDEGDWRKAAPRYGLAASKPASLLAPDIRKPDSGSAPEPRSDVNQDRGFLAPSSRSLTQIPSSLIGGAKRDTGKPAQADDHFPMLQQEDSLDSSRSRPRSPALGDYPVSPQIRLRDPQTQFEGDFDVQAGSAHPLQPSGRSMVAPALRMPSEPRNILPPTSPIDEQPVLGDVTASLPPGRHTEIEYERRPQIGQPRMLQTIKTASSTTAQNAPDRLLTAATAPQPISRQMVQRSQHTPTEPERGPMAETKKTEQRRHLSESDRTSDVNSMAAAVWSLLRARLSAEAVRQGKYR